MPTIYRYSFDSKVLFDDVRSCLNLAVMAAEGLHGEIGVRMEASYRSDEKLRRCVIDASTAVGRDIARIFSRFLTRLWNRNEFTIESLERNCHCGKEHT